MFENYSNMTSSGNKVMFQAENDVNIESGFEYLATYCRFYSVPYSGTSIHRT
jgi:hypothetical protein